MTTRKRGDNTSRFLFCAKITSCIMKRYDSSSGRVLQAIGESPNPVEVMGSSPIHTLFVFQKIKN